MRSQQRCLMGSGERECINKDWKDFRHWLNERKQKHQVQLEIEDAVPL